MDSIEYINFTFFLFPFCACCSFDDDDDTPAAAAVAAVLTEDTFIKERLISSNEFVD